MEKSRAQGTKYALLYPGGGYFYTGRWFLGLLDAVISGALIVLLASRLAQLVEGIPGSLQRCLTLGALLFLEKTLTTMHTRRIVDEINPDEIPEPESPPSRRPRIEPTLGS